MTTLAERVPLDDITAQARQVKFGRLLLTIFASVLFAIGWLAARTFFCIAWCSVAVKVGWKEGRGLSQPQAQERR